MSEDKVSEYLDVLELKPGASLEEIHKAYLSLREVYASGSIAFLPIEEEAGDSFVKNTQDKVEEAYKWLVEHMERAEGRGEERVGTDESETVPPDRIDGKALERLRLERGLSRSDVEFSTKISRKYIEAIEAQNLKVLPEELYIRGYLKSYARFLNLDPERVANEYMKNAKPSL